MKKHNREQENSQPEKHSWFKSKKDDAKQEVTEEVKEEVSEEVTDVAEDVAESAEKVTEVATNDEIVEKVAEDVAESAEKVTDVATNDEIIEKVAEDVAENTEKVTDVATNEADAEESEAGTAADAIAELVAESNPEPKPETESETNSISEAAAIIPVAALAELAKPEDSEIAELESGAETESDATVGESKENEESEAEDEEETDKEESDEDEDEETDKKAAKAKKKDREESQKEKSALYMFFDTIKFVAIGLLIGILLVVFVIQRNDVYGSSMEPTLYSGDAVFVEMISVYTGNFDRGDIITIDAKGMEGYSHEENLIKRIVGLPGETIKIADGDVYINGQLLDESDYLPAGTKTYVGAEGQSRGYDEMTLGPDEYYCMGDNRGGSNDSRRMGPFKKSQIDAKVLARIYPFNKMKFF